MIRRTTSFLLWICLALPLAAPGGEQPGPGLEVFDSGLGLDSSGIRDDVYGEPQGSNAAPRLASPDPGTPIPHSAPVAPYSSPVAPDSSPEIPAYSQEQPFEENGTAAEAGPVGPSRSVGDASGEAQAEVNGMPSSPSEILASLNARNPRFPGLGAAASRGDLSGAAQIIWRTLRERRVVGAALARGPKASSDIAPAYAYQAALSAINHFPAPGLRESPSLAAERINAIIDSFADSPVEDPALASAMEQALARLHADIRIVRDALQAEKDDGAWLEMSRTYVRAASACDFFVFPARELASFANAVMAEAGSFFYPDGASRAGDAAGISGNLFQIVLGLDAYGRDDARFRNSINPVWRALARPARLLADLAGRPGLEPRFAPPRPGDIRHSFGPVDLAADHLGFRAEVDLRRGLARTRRWFTGTGGAPKAQ